MAGVEVGIGAELAREVAGLRHLDLDDFRAEQRKFVGAQRTSEHIAQVKDADPGQGLAHSAYDRGGTAAPAK